MDDIIYISMNIDVVFSNAVDNFKSKFEGVVEWYVLTLPRSGTHMHRYRCCMQGTPGGVVGTLTLTSLVLVLTLSSGIRKYRYQCMGIHSHLEEYLRKKICLWVL